MVKYWAESIWRYYLAYISRIIIRMSLGNLKNDCTILFIDFSLFLCSKFDCFWELKRSLKRNYFSSSVIITIPEFMLLKVYTLKSKKEENLKIFMLFFYFLSSVHYFANYIKEGWTNYLLLAKTHNANGTKGSSTGYLGAKKPISLQPSLVLKLINLVTAALSSVQLKVFKSLQLIFTIF